MFLGFLRTDLKQNVNVLVKYQNNNLYDPEMLLHSTCRHVDL